jgi:hypothetical protein
MNIATEDWSPGGLTARSRLRIGCVRARRRREAYDTAEASGTSAGRLRAAFTDGRRRSREIARERND